MKNLIFGLMVLSFLGIRAQHKQTLTDQISGGGNNTNWQNAILRADGFTQIKGVEAFCQKANCDGEEYLLVKFVNKNNYRVRVEWIDAIYVGGTWFYSKNPAPSVLYLEASSETEGSCNDTGKLKVKINSIIENPVSFEHYTVSGLEVK